MAQTALEHGSVDGALQVSPCQDGRMSSPQWHPVPLQFEMPAEASTPVDGVGLTVTAVVRDEHGIRINYEVMPSLPTALGGPTGTAEDDLGNRYEDLGGAIGLDTVRDRTDGVLTMPLPPPDAETLRVSLRWHRGPKPWQQRTHEVLVLLASSALP
jgi:hypothetical protein